MPFFPKKYTFHKQWAWQAPDNATPLSFRNQNAHNQSFQMRDRESLYHSYFMEKLKKYTKKLRSKIAIVTDLRLRYSFVYAWHSLSILTS